jgi:hypothetical protein
LRAPDLDALETLNGRRYTNLTQCIATPSSIRFTHATGSASVRLDTLPEPTRNHLGYDPSAAAVYDEKVTQLEAELAESNLLHQLSVGPEETRSARHLYVDTGAPNSKIRTIRQISRAQAKVLASNSIGTEWVWVNGYYRSDGSYVPGHFRTNPDTSIRDNWSTIGNRNPTTGEWGSVLPTTPSSGTTQVRGYYRKDGTYVRSHSRRK